MNNDFLEAEILINARRRIRKRICSAGLVTIETYVAVDQYVTDSQLLDGVGTLRAITRSSSSITYSHNAALEAIVFFYWHAFCSERSIAF